MANLCTANIANWNRLSPLQTMIISIAKDNSGSVCARDVLIHYYGFKPVRDPNGLRRGQPVFKKDAIGFNLYNARTVSVCKAFNRLVNRGLAIRTYGGIRLKNYR